VIVPPTGSSNVVVSNITFDNVASIKDVAGWTIGSQAGGQTSIEQDPLRAGKALKAHYPAQATGGIYNWAGIDLSKYETHEIFVEFDARIPGTPGGSKFFKIFGGTDADQDYANTTFGLVADAGGTDNGTMRQISFGDGTNTSSDTANVINFGGEYPDWIGRSYGKGAKIITGQSNWKSTDWGNTWHHFETRIKFNTGSCIAGKPNIPEVNDGAYLLKIDGKLYVEATGLFNRHCKNLPIRNINFFDWAQNGTNAFDIWLDNIKVTVVLP